VNIKLHQAVYYIKIKGYLSAVDLLKEAAAINSKIGKSELLKQHLFTALSNEEIEGDIRKQLIEAVKLIPASRWEDRAFYEIEDILTEKKAEAEAPVEPKTPENNEAVQQQ
jgi:hypothetical protein